MIWKDGCRVDVGVWDKTRSTSKHGKSFDQRLVSSSGKGRIPRLWAATQYRSGRVTLLSLVNDRWFTFARPHNKSEITTILNLVLHV